MKEVRTERSIAISDFSSAAKGSEAGTGITRTSYADSDFHFQEAYPTGKHQQLDSNVQTATTPGALSPQQLSKKYTKLEVVTARQVEILLRMQYIMIGLGGLYTLVMVVLVNTVYSKVFYTPKADGWQFDLRIYNLPWSLLWFNYISRFVMFIATVILTIVYSIRILSLRSVQITHEQVWVILLLVSISFYLLPLHEIIAIHDQLVPNKGFMWQKANWWKNFLEPIVQIAFNFGFSTCTIFYVWASMHSFRFLSANLNARFYYTKVSSVSVITQLFSSSYPNNSIRFSHSYCM